MDSRSFIYKIYNEASDLFYIGSTKNSINDRLIQHKSNSKKNKNHSSSILFDMYSDNKIIILEEYSNIDRIELYKREAEYIAKFAGDKNCMNVYGKLNIGSSKDKREYMLQYVKLTVKCEACNKDIRRGSLSRHKQTQIHLENLKLFEENANKGKTIHIETDKKECIEIDPILSKKQIYYQTHKNYIRNVQKEYKNNNKEKLKDYLLEWKENLPDERKNQMKKKAKERVSEKMKCSTCDCFFKRGSLLRHKKTQKHLKILKENDIEEEFIEMSETVIIESVEYQN
jgi:hypothetical protein